LEGLQFEMQAQIYQGIFRANNGYADVRNPVLYLGICSMLSRVQALPNITKMIFSPHQHARYLPGSESENPKVYSNRIVARCQAARSKTLGFVCQHRGKLRYDPQSIIGRVYTTAKYLYHKFSTVFRPGSYSEELILHDLLNQSSSLVMMKQGDLGKCLQRLVYMYIRVYSLYARSAVYTYSVAPFLSYCPMNGKSVCRRILHMPRTCDWERNTQVVGRAHHTIPQMSRSGQCQ
jgi:hypothetical protein